MKALKNSLSFALVTVALVGAASANAATDNPNALPKFDLGTPKTSQQVQQELIQARAAGLVDVHPDALPVLKVGQPKTRAQVQAELVHARAAGEMAPIPN